MQLLYQLAVTGDSSDVSVSQFWNDLPPKLAPSRSFAETLVRAVLERTEDIDAMIDTAASNWQLDRIARIDLCILRLALAELLAFPEVPAEVVIDEAIEIARKYSDAESPAFVNGVLDRVARDRHLLVKE